MKENSTYHDGLESNHLPESLRENPFGVPENYFSDLESKIIAQVKWIACTDDSVFKVPEGYFDSLPDVVLSKIAADSLKAQVAVDGFAIPEQYSDKLTENIFHRISEENLKEKIQSDGFAVPVDYHADLEETIFARIAEEKLKDRVPVTGLDLPPHYFDTLSDKIIGAIQDIKEERGSTPIRRLGKQKKWYTRYAVAASFTAMLGLGGYWGYQFQQQNTIAQDNVAEEQLSQHLSEIPKQEIINYLSASASGDDIIYMSQYTDETNLPTKGFGTNISEQEIEDYLNYTL